MIRAWSEAEVARMDIPQASKLREELRGGIIASDTPPQRRSSLALLHALDKRIGQAPASVEQRASSAREFLYPGSASDAKRRRAWLAAVELHGSTKEAVRRGYRDPGKASA